mmetsp:Transcript_1648/g.4131  ORF Transcript_1648/g.4131 Transcript_1648/m.4131 type:complete len:284 (+) Transcript_1648:84-935(+)
MGCSASKGVDPTQPDPGAIQRGKTKVGAGAQDTDPARIGATVVASGEGGGRAAECATAPRRGARPRGARLHGPVAREARGAPRGHARVGLQGDLRVARRDERRRAALLAHGRRQRRQVSAHGGATAPRLPLQPRRRVALLQARQPAAVVARRAPSKPRGDALRAATRIQGGAQRGLRRAAQGGRHEGALRRALHGAAAEGQESREAIAHHPRCPRRAPEAGAEAAAQRHRSAALDAPAVAAPLRHVARGAADQGGAREVQAQGAARRRGKEPRRRRGVPAQHR